MKPGAIRAMTCGRTSWEFTLAPHDAVTRDFNSAGIDRFLESPFW